jgi:glycerate 2-kinase
VKVVLAPDGFGGTLTAREAASALADGWRLVRPDDDLVLVPMSDGGEGLLDAVATAADTWVTVEAAGPQGHPLEASFLLRPDGTAVIESASACGLHLLPPERRTPRLATSYGVGQLLDAAREMGAARIVLGLGGSASVDGGTGALTSLGFRLTVDDGSGLKIGGEELGRVAAAGRDWVADWRGVEVVLLADVDVPLALAAPRFGPQKGATPQDVEHLTAALATWADVAERDLAGRPLRDVPGAGAAGGLGFGLAAALPAVRWQPGAAAVAEIVGLPETMADADLVVTGEGRLDATTATTKVVGYLRQHAGVPTAAVVGSVTGATAATGLVDVEASAPEGPGEDPAGEVAAAAARLAARRG